MGLLAQLFLSFADKRSHVYQDKKAHHIFYKIVDSINENQQYALQCINTKAIFRIKISDIVFDPDILHSLHPIQACYIGIEYAQYLKNQPDNPLNNQHSPKQQSNKAPIHRYGKYCISYQDRAGNIRFIDDRTQQDFLMDPRDIALSEELITEFDAAQAFYIGLQAGFKLNNPIKKHTNNPDPITKERHLKIVKTCEE